MKTQSVAPKKRRTCLHVLSDTTHPSGSIPPINLAQVLSFHPTVVDVAPDPGGLAYVRTDACARHALVEESLLLRFQLRGSEP